MLLGALLFWATTCTTKQHFVVDGIAGALTGWIGYTIVWRRRGDT